MSDVRYRRLNSYLRSFFNDYLKVQRGLSINTIRSYRDTWCLLLRYGMDYKKMPNPEEWRINQVDRQLILDFLVYLKDKRRVCARTRNQRLAAVQAFFQYLRMFEPELEHHCLRILSIPSKKTHHPTIGFLESDELCAVLKSVMLKSPLAQRDIALLVFAYNTGARVHEIANARKKDIISGKSPCIRILGKGNRERFVPLWEVTLKLLEVYLKKYRAHPKDSAQDCYIFLGNRGQHLTRFQVGRIITKYIEKASDKYPGMSKKRLCAHSMRHTTAVHLFQAGVELNLVKAWLGHSSVESTQVYLELDLKRKREVLERLVTPEFYILFLQGEPGRSEIDIALIKWLDTL